MIDLCVVISGINLDVLVPLFFETLKSRCNLEQINVHVIVKRGIPENVVLDKEVSDNIMEYITSQNVIVYEVPYFLERYGWSNKQTHWMASDCALTLEYIMQNCGQSKWRIISHLDVYFKKDIFAHMSPCMTEERALVGLYSMGICAINKEAVEQAFIGFQSMTGFFAVPIGNGGHKIIHGSDPRCTNKSIRIEGFDVLDLMEMNFRGKAWDTYLFSRKELSDYFNHMGQGSGYHQHPSTALIQRNTVIDYLRKFNIKPIQ